MSAEPNSVKRFFFALPAQQILDELPPERRREVLAGMLDLAIATHATLTQALELPAPSSSAPRRIRRSQVDA